MTYARAWSSLKFGAIRPLTAGLAAPPRSVGKIPKGKGVATFSAFFDRILFILAVNDDFK